MRCSGPLGFLPILTIALSCSSSEPELSSANGAGATSSGGASGSDSESTAGTMTSGGSTIVAPNLGDPLNCCSAHEEPGCENDAVAQCVCGVQTYCCSDRGAWDTACVRGVDELGCGICPIVISDPGSGGAGGAEPSSEGGAAGNADQVAGEWTSCCEKQLRAGCGDSDVEAKVCTVDAYCCEKKWDHYCALEAETLGEVPCAAYNGAGGAGGQAG